jgi:hypothetical protein
VVDEGEPAIISGAFDADDAGFFFALVINGIFAAHI